MINFLVEFWAGVRTSGQVCVGCNKRVDVMKRRICGIDAVALRCDIDETLRGEMGVMLGGSSKQLVMN